MNVLNVRVELGLVLSTVEDGDLILALQEAVDEVRAGWAGPSDDEGFHARLPLGLGGGYHRPRRRVHTPDIRASGQTGRGAGSRRMEFAGLAHRSSYSDRVMIALSYKVASLQWLYCTATLCWPC